MEGYSTTSYQFWCYGRKKFNPEDKIIVFYEDYGDWKPLNHEATGIVKMKGALSIEDSSYIVYGKNAYSELTIYTEKGNCIELHWENGEYEARAQNTVGFLSMYEDKLFSNSKGRALIIEIFNLVEHKTIKLIVE